MSKKIGLAFLFALALFSLHTLPTYALVANSSNTATITKVDIKAGASVQDGPITVPAGSVYVVWQSYNGSAMVNTYGNTPCVGSANPSRPDFAGNYVSSGDIFFNQTVSTAYTITCGTVSDTVVVNIAGQPVYSGTVTPSSIAGSTPPPASSPTTIPFDTLDLTVNGSNGPVALSSGQTVTLSWQAPGASSCSLSGGYSQSVGVSGSVTLNSGQTGYPIAGATSQYNLFCQWTPANATAGNVATGDTVYVVNPSVSTGAPVTPLSNPEAPVNPTVVPVVPPATPAPQTPAPPPRTVSTTATVDLKAGFGPASNTNFANATIQSDAPMSNPLLIQAPSEFYLTWTSSAPVTNCQLSDPTSGIAFPSYQNYIPAYQNYVEYAPTDVHYPSTTGTTYTITCSTTSLTGAPAVTSDSVTAVNATVPRPVGVDLTASAPALEFAPPVTVGVPTIFYSLIMNNGTATSGPSFANQFKISTSATGVGATSLPPATISTLAMLPSLPGIPTGGSVYALSPSYTFTSVGTYYVQACADSNNSIVEANEGNNCSTWTPIAVSAANTATVVCPSCIVNTNGNTGTGNNSALTACLQLTSVIAEGSTGSDVTALQQFLVSQGFLTMPVGATYGTFGSLTAQAVVKFQTANGLDPVGSVGPMTRAKIAAISCNGATGVSNTSSTTSTLTSCTTGALFDQNTGLPCGSASAGVSSNGSVSVDLKVNDSDGPISVAPGATILLSWHAQPATSSTLRCGGSGGSGVWGDALNSIYSFNPTVNTTYTVTCTDLVSGQSASDSVTVNMLSDSDNGSANTASNASSNTSSSGLTVAQTNAIASSHTTPFFEVYAADGVTATNYLTIPYGQTLILPWGMYGSNTWTCSVNPGGATGSGTGVLQLASTNAAYPTTSGTRYNLSCTNTNGQTSASVITVMTSDGPTASLYAPVQQGWTYTNNMGEYAQAHQALTIDLSQLNQTTGLWLQWNVSQGPVIPSTTSCSFSGFPANNFWSARQPLSTSGYQGNIYLHAVPTPSGLYGSSAVTTQSLYGTLPLTTTGNPTYTITCTDSATGKTSSDHVTLTFVN